ncbi:MAG TPA: hydroxysqualene dehydroxylase HpnE [Nakamurella sp.]|nr:hydroxysqualene dehydroxylase HpnE [Nakamurella sp.]
MSGAPGEQSGTVSEAGVNQGRGDVAVVGGGLAGIAAAVALADRGWRVTLLESRPRLGGAAYSFDRSGLTVDTGVHVVLRCYTGYRTLLARMGVADLVPPQPRMSITVMRPHAPPTRLTRGRLGPPPAHLLPALAGYRELSARERVAAARAALAMRRLDPDDPALDRIGFGDWLSRHGQNHHVTESLWGLLCVAALNIDPAQASTALMARVLRTGLLESVRAGDIAVPAVPLSELHDGPARRLLARLGVAVRTGARVTAVQRTAGGYRVAASGGDLPVDAVVVAVPHPRAAQLVPEEAVPDRQGWAGLGSSPIVNVHLHLDRPVTGDALPPGGFAAVLGSPLQWVFDRTSAARTTGQYLVSSVSAADPAIGRPAADLLAVARRELGTLFPAAEHAALLDGFVTREPNATFRQRAGSGALRPAAATRWPGLALAGAWTATGLPDTLEGAVRSGQLAAQALDNDHHDDRHAPKTPTGAARWLESCPMPDTPAEVMVR